MPPRFEMHAYEFFRLHPKGPLFHPKQDKGVHDQAEEEVSSLQTYSAMLN